jgi:hypothetical protein
MPSRSLFPWLAGAFALLLVLHLVLAFRFPGPILYEDTMGYLAIARDIAGQRPTPALNAPHGTYHFGYPLLLAPLYLVQGSSWRVFQGARVLDSLLASSQVLLLYLLGRGPFGLGRGFALGTALAAALYPAWLLQSSFVWTESLFAFLFSLWVLLAWEALRRRGGPWLLAFGLTGAFLYAVHPRGLGLVAVTLGALAIWALRERTDPRWLRWSAATAVVATAAVAATRSLNGRFLARLWLAPPRMSEGSVLGPLLDPAVWWGSLPARVAGQTWYLLAATLGIFGVGAFVLAVQAWPQGAGPKDRERLAALTLAGAAAVLFASAAVMLPAFRSDHLVYGRYNEALLGPFLVAGLAGLTGPRGARLARLAGAAALLGILGVLLPRILPAELQAAQPMPLNVLGVLLWNPWATLDLGRTTWLSLGALAVFAAAALTSRRAAVALLAGFFTVSAMLLEQTMLPWGRAVRAVVTLQDAIRPLAPASLSYDRAGLSTFGFNGYQFWLDGIRFQLFDGTAGERPRDPLVIAPKAWGAQAAGFRLVAGEPGMDQALWVAPGPLQAELDRRGWMIPADPSAPLPPEACRSRIERLDGGDEPLILQAGGREPLRFRVEHAGRGTAWIPLGSTISPWGSVRLGAQWFRPGEAAPFEALPSRAELPRMLRPGEVVEIEMAVRAERAEGVPLAPGSYILEVALVQEGVQWFPGVGDAALRIPVEVR